MPTEDLTRWTYLEEHLKIEIRINTILPGVSYLAYTIIQIIYLDDSIILQDTVLSIIPSNGLLEEQRKTASALVLKNVTKHMCKRRSLRQPSLIVFVPPYYIFTEMEESKKSQSKIKIGPGVKN